jgi:hypothetical protein
LRWLALQRPARAAMLRFDFMTAASAFRVSHPLGLAGVFTVWLPV